MAFAILGTLSLAIAHVVMAIAEDQPIYWIPAGLLFLVAWLVVQVQL